MASSSTIDEVLRRVFGDTGAEDATYLKNLFAEMVSASQLAAKYPFADSDYGYFAYGNALGSTTQAQGARLEQLTTSLAERSGAGSVTAAQLRSARRDADACDALTDVVDGLLEAADFDLDEAKGATDHRTVAVSKTEVVQSARSFSATLRPQRSFPDKVDNSRLPFVPKITSKPNALTELPQWAPPRPGAFDMYPHPYLAELAAFQPTDSLLTRCDPQPFKTLAEVPFEYVDTVAKFNDMLAHLESPAVNEIAIDLEAHSIFSFQGFVCLAQLSSRFRDFVVDTLTLRGEMCRLLNVFTNPRVVKVMHGCNNDVLWLQRDFGLYLVNVFDTGQAARMLSYPSFGLGYLLQHFCRVNTSGKSQFQRADWRIRPLPADMIKYAREDTHYLLYVYDVLRNELLDRSNAQANMLRAVWSASTELCAAKYEKEIFTPDAHLQLLDVLGLSDAVPQTRAVFAALFEWRDRIAREIDESTLSVMHHNVMKKLAVVAPTNVTAVMDAINPIPPPLRPRVSELVEVIKGALHTAATAPLRSSGGAAAQAPPAQGGAPASHVADFVMSDDMTFEDIKMHAGWLKGPDVHSGHRKTRLPEPHPLAVELAASAFRAFESEPTQEDDVADLKRRRALADQVRASLAELNIYNMSGYHLPEPRAEASAGPAIPEPAADDSHAGLAVPRSLSEIFDISNQNRKRNKDKKKHKDGDSDSDGGGAGSTTGGTVVARRKAASAEGYSKDVAAFLKSTGWVDSEEAYIAKAAEANADSDRKSIDSGPSGAPTSFSFNEGVSAVAGAAIPANHGKDMGPRRGGRGGAPGAPRGRGGNRRGGGPSAGLPGVPPPPASFNPYAAPMNPSGGDQRRGGAGGRPGRGRGGFDRSMTTRPGAQDQKWTRS